MSRVALCVMSSGLVLALGCGGSEDRPSGPAGRLAIEVAPLTLDGVIDAEYTVTVRNGPGGSGEVVWERRVTSAQFGDGAGSLSYVGPCDAATGVNTVTLQLHDLWDAGGEIDPGTYQNPTPLEREAVCVANADVTVTFDMTIVRESNQGFFDVAVDFEDVFCSAKLDCEDDQGGDLDLLHRPGGGPRDMTAVFAFACTGTLAAGETVMYMDDLRIACSGLARDVLIDPTGLGNIDTNASPSENADGYLFGAAVYRGAEALAGKAYWNVNLGLDAEAFTRAGDCTLRARATASSELWLPEHDGFPLPPASVYPVIHWDVPLSSSIARVCGQHAVNAGDGAVSTVYEGYLPVDVNAFTWAAETVYLRNRYRPSTGEAIRAGGDLCNPPCVSGRCVGVDQCDCDTGWQGGVCDEPVCTDDCNAGTCTAPGICDCAATGYAGERCETNIDECASGGHDCHADATCTDTPGSWDCVCNSGYSGDGVTCADVDECLTDNGGCDANATCTNTAGSRTCACNSGYSGDGVNCADVNECLTNNGGCAHSCHNTSGGYSCSCNSGYVLAGDGHACNDIDECLTGNGGCDANALCTNTPGSRTCACNAGFVGDGSTCVACQPAHPLASTRAWLPEAIETIASYPTRTFGEVSLGVGVRGQGLVFDGADDYIEVIDSDPLYPTGALSIEAWVKTSAAGVEQVVASKYECGDDCVGSVSNSRFMLRVDPTGKVTFNVRDSLGVEDLVTGATTVTDGVFHHVVGVRDVTGSTLRVYVDGVLDGSAGINGTAGLADDDGGVDNLIVGAISDHADGRVSFFHGTIDELALHHEALTPTQVATRYASAVPSCACPVGYEPDGAGGCADIDECSVGAAGCSPHGACTNTTGSYTCECPVSSGYFGDGFFCGPPYTSCLDALEAGETTDGLQWFDEGPGMLVWCDQTTDGGGWMLMAKFSQHISIDNLDQATYDAYFGSSHVNGYKTWIQGEAQGTPLSPDPRYDGFVVESHDWSNFPGISVGNQGIVELRQQFFKRSREQEFDVTFESKGGTVDHAALPQNDIVNKWFRAWWLGGRRVLKDDTGITWDTANDWFRFWLPIDGSGDSWASDNFITGCAGFSLDPFACGIVTPANRRYGNAGIIGSYADYQDPAAAWAPHLNAAATSDIVYVHQAHTQYGESGDPMTLLYWLREKRCATHSDCAGGGCMNGYCQGYERSCKRILQFFNPSAPDGIYTIDISEQALGHPLKPPMEVYCDMTNGGWTRLYRDDFETGVPTGWLENRTTECGGDTILGGYFNESSATTVNAKAYPSLSFPAEQIKLNMDFVKLDSWDGETVDIKLAYQSGYSESFCHCHQGCGGVCGGAALCGAGSAEDQRISVQGIPQFFGSNGNADYDVRVETTLDQENSDESFGVDNVEIWAID